MRPRCKELFQFLISCLILAGGGYLAARYPELRGEVSAAVAAVIGWWFTKAIKGGKMGTSR